MRNKLTLLFVAFLSLYNTSVFSADVYWIKMKPNFTYKDLSVYCATYMNSNQLFLAMEASEGKVSRAIFRKSLSVNWQSLELSKAETEKIQLNISNENLVSINAIELSAKSIVWVLSNGSVGDTDCSPSQPILSISPNFFKFKFGGNRDFSLNAKELFSNSGKFSGKLKNGDSFYAELQFMQSSL